ncbi:zinc finger protein 354B-like [Ylistrum balloti]|uniref:zinc finger protein 354B-like n=1 Tax=Ylistrum balloti TaxID=509963 RepID=UPI002905F633|nr:zinc finger protein 354B-like [Ylistrum balloti]
MADTNIIASNRPTRLRRGTLVSQEDKRVRKRSKDMLRHKSRICVGQQIGRWMAVKVSIGLSKNEDVAKMLLDSWCLINSFFVDDHGNFPAKDSSPEIQTKKTVSPHHLQHQKDDCTRTMPPLLKETSQNFADNCLTTENGKASNLRPVDIIQHRDTNQLGEVCISESNEMLQSVDVDEVTPNISLTSEVKDIKCEPELYIETERKRMTDGVTSPSTDNYLTSSEEDTNDSDVDNDVWAVSIASDSKQVKLDIPQEVDNDVELDLSCSEEDVEHGNLSSHPGQQGDIHQSSVQQKQSTPLKRRKLKKNSNSRAKVKTTIATRKKNAPCPGGGYRQSKRLQKKGRRSYVDDLQEAFEVEADEDKERQSVSDHENLQSDQVTESHGNISKGDFSSMHPKKRHTARYSEAEMNDCVPVVHLQTQHISSETLTNNKHGEKSKVKKKTGDTEVKSHRSDVGYEQQGIETFSDKDNVNSDYLEEPDLDDSDYDPALDEEEPPSRKKRKYTKRKNGKKDETEDGSESVVKVSNDGESDKKASQKTLKKTRAKRKTHDKGEKLNCLPGSRRSDKYFPDINVQLEDHADKYEVITWTSHCKKDRGVDVEQKSFHGYGCKMCGGVFKTTDRSVMEVHLKEHMQGKLTCGECGQVFSYYTQLRKHRLKLHVEAKYTCEECGQQFHYIKVLHTHLSKVHNKNVYQCKKCQMNFQSNADRKAHSLEMHPECFEKCKVCGETVNMTLCKNAMERHMRSYWCQRTASSICEICGKEVQRLSIKTHIRRVHHKTKTLRCDICDFSTHLGSTYKLHMMTHTGEHPVKCSLCDFSCIRSYQLTSHMRTHTGDKPYKCDQCNYASAWNVQLKDHKKAHYSDDRVNCDACNIMFKDRRGLNMHISKEHANTSVADSFVVKKNPVDSNNYISSGAAVDTNSYIARGHQSDIGAYSGLRNLSSSRSDNYIVRGNLDVQNTFVSGNSSVTDAYIARGNNLY